MVSRYNTGILFFSSASYSAASLSKILKTAANFVKGVLYVRYEPITDADVTTKTMSGGIVGKRQSCVRYSRKIQSFVTSTYFCASCVTGLDVRFLISNIGGGRQVDHQKLGHRPEVLLVDNLRFANHDLNVLSSLMSENIDIPIKAVDCDWNNDVDECEEDEEKKRYPYVACGGTFDRLHSGHKILLSVAAMASEKQLTVGVTDGAMIIRKKLFELMQSAPERITALKQFMEDIKPNVHHDIVPITDPFGPTTVRPEYSCIVVSEETMKGANMINVERRERSMNELDVLCIDLVDDVAMETGEEKKISSSSLRKRLLGTVINPVKSNRDIPNKPYVIGLTGGIASGKSSIAKRLCNLGAAIIDCDKLGHRCYQSGTLAFEEIVAEFGCDTVGKDGQIDRRILGPIVFNDKDKLNSLNRIVWPAIKRMILDEIAELRSRGVKVVVVDAAVLLSAGWETLCHEVWGTIIPKHQAVSRIVERNGISDDEAASRVDSQATNDDIVKCSNVVLSTLWAPDITQIQVEKAWKLLTERIPPDS